MPPDLPAFCSVRRKLANPFLLPLCLLLLVAAGNCRTFVSCSTWQPLPRCCLLEETPPHPVAGPSSGALCSGAVTPFCCSQASCPALAPCAPRLYCWGGLRSGLTCFLLSPPIHSPRRPQSFYVAFLIKTCEWMFTALRKKPKASSSHGPVPPCLLGLTTQPFAHVQVSGTQAFQILHPPVFSPSVSAIPAPPQCPPTAPHRANARLCFIVILTPSSTLVSPSSPVIHYLRSPLCYLHGTDHNVQVFKTSLSICFAP